MVNKLWRSLTIVAVLMCSIGLGTANASLREPRRVVTASFGLTFSTPILAVPCGVRFRYNKFFLAAAGKEIDFSSPAAGLSGRLRLKLQWAESSDSAVLGHMKAVLTDPSAGDVRYSGAGTFVGQEGPAGTIQARGLLDAVLYANGMPTTRHLIANLAFKIDLAAGHVGGGFGDHVSAGPGIAVETTGKTC